MKKLLTILFAGIMIMMLFIACEDSGAEADETVEAVEEVVEDTAVDEALEEVLEDESEEDQAE